MRFAAMVTSLCLAVLATRPLSAQAVVETAPQAFQRGSEAYERGDYAEAAQAFEQAYRLRPHAAALFNEARALERVGDAPRAADAYELALARNELRPQDQADTEARLSALSRTLGSVLIVGPAESRGSIGSLQHVPLPIRAHLAIGRYELSLERKDGQRATLLVGVSAGHVTELRIPEHGKPWSDPKAAVSAQAPRTASASWHIPTGAYLTAGVAVAATGLGAYLGLAGLDARDQFDASHHLDQAAHDRAVRLRTSANVAFAIGLAAAVTTGFVVYRARRVRAQMSLTTPQPRAAPSFALSVCGRF